MSPRQEVKPVARADLSLTEPMKLLARQLWIESSPICHGDAVDHYLTNLGIELEEFPKLLRCHPRVGYIKRQTEVTVTRGDTDAR